MSAPPLAMRPYLAADAAHCAAIFRASIEELAADDYDEEQRAAWANHADDDAAFGAKLADGLTLVATIASETVGFASLKGPDIIDMLYVHPQFARRGIGAALLDALARLAQARGVARLTSDVSDTARSVFERQGFVAQKRNLVRKDEQWLANTTMTKPLAAADPASRQTTHH
jgi:putative acetyltransferase